jgi:hypothetical protein
MNMRNYVKRNAATPMLNIMTPTTSSFPNQRGSYPMPIRSRTSRIGLEIYGEGQKKEESTEATMAVSTFLRNRRQNFTERLFFLPGS